MTRGFLIDVSVSVYEIGDVFVVVQCPYCDWFVERRVPTPLPELNDLADTHRKEHPWPTT